MNQPKHKVPLNFIENIVQDDVAKGKNQGKVITRFPPEPNGYLHIGHAKSICLNFDLAQKYEGAYCNLRFDDTNPEKEEARFSKSIIEDVHWLGYQEAQILHASDYFEQLFEYAVALIKKGKAYVCDLDAEQIREQRGTLTSAGTESPYRNRSIDENFARFQEMRAGDFEDGACVLRAKIDMAASNINMRDPVIYRVRHIKHPRTGAAWCIYPAYDFAHCVSDSIEGVTHSICTLEFEDHRPLYDWFLEQLDIHHPQQIEFARLELTHTITSKRKLKTLIQDGVVEAWDDPRLLTISGMRRRGIPPQAIREFCRRIGVTKKDSQIEIAALETCVRDELNICAPRAIAILNPLKVVITNYPTDKTEYINAVNNPNNPDAGTRKLSFSRELYVEREDFMEDPPKQFFRLSPGREVRLKYAYYIVCEEVIKDDNGEVVELRCVYDPASYGGGTTDRRKVKGTVHWLDSATAVATQIYLYDRLFRIENPTQGELSDALNPQSKTVIENALIEPSLKDASPEQTYQFERLGYFIADSKLHSRTAPVFNRTITLYDSWSKIKQRNK